MRYIKSHQVEAIIALAKQRGWSYISVVYDDDSYGLKGLHGKKLRSEINTGLRYNRYKQLSMDSTPPFGYSYIHKRSIGQLGHTEILSYTRL